MLGSEARTGLAIHYISYEVVEWHKKTGTSEEDTLSFIRYMLYSLFLSLSVFL